MVKIDKLDEILQVAIDSHFPQECFTPYTKYVNIDGIEMLCKYDEFTNTTIIGFGGTDELRDWATNILFRPYHHPQGYRLHRGFYFAFSRLSNKLFEYTFIRKSKRLYLTGFSQGGALAQICALQLRMFEIPIELYVMGSPLVGDKNFHSKIQAEVYKSYWFSNDPVHYLPFGFGYSHPENNIPLGCCHSLHSHDIYKYKKEILDYELKLSNSKR